MMTVAAIGAVALGEYGEAASLAFLFSISEALEGYALARTRRGLRALLSLVPESVTVRRNGIDVETAPSDLLVGDIMVVGPGERIATDGRIVLGTASVSEQLLTGESRPRTKRPGDDVLGGGLNLDGELIVRVSAPASEGSLSRLIDLVRAARASRRTPAGPKASAPCACSQTTQSDRQRTSRRTGRRLHRIRGRRTADRARPPAARQCAGRLPAWPPRARASAG